MGMNCGGGWLNVYEYLIKLNKQTPPKGLIHDSLYPYVTRKTTCNNGAISGASASQTIRVGKYGLYYIGILVLDGTIKIATL